MSFFCKLYELWIIPNVSIDIGFWKVEFLNQLCDYGNLKKFKLFYSLIQFLNSLNFFERAIGFMSFEVLQFISKTGSVCKKIWIFQANSALTLTNSLHRLGQFVKKLRFLDKLFQLWRFSFFPSCFIDEIGSRVCFHARYLSLKKVEKIWFFMYLGDHKKL